MYNKFKQAFFHLLVFTFLICGKVFANNPEYTQGEKLIGDYAFNRSLFGISKIRSWYPYLQFEESALSNENIDNAKNGSAKALLKLAFLASGDIEKEQTYQDYYKQYNSFINKIIPKVKIEKSVYNKGKILFDGMCEEFYKQGFFNDQNKGYSYDKSNITAIFKNSRYNCISSALLYMIIAREFGLDVSCVVVPSHVFVQIKAEKNRIIEVETTTKKGYDFKHTKEYFKKANVQWLKQRGLTSITYDDYLKRRIISPFDAVYENMYNQHTNHKNMSAYNRNKIYEAMGYLKDTEFAQIARLGVYNNEFFYLKKIDNTRDINRMFEIILPYVMDVYKKGESLELKNTSAILLSYHGNICSRDGRLKDAEVIANTLFRDFKPNLTNAKEILHNIYAMTSAVTNSYVREKRFEECDRFLNTNKKYMDFNRSEALYCFRYLNSRRASYYWDQRDWEKVSIYLKNELEFIKDKKDRELNKKNRIASFLQWSDVFAMDKKYEEAIKILDQCLSDIPKCEPCQKRKNQIMAVK